MLTPANHHTPAPLPALEVATNDWLPWRLRCQIRDAAPLSTWAVAQARALYPPVMSERRSALVTGAGSGIGRALAMQLSDRGDRLYVLDINEQAVSSLASESRVEEAVMATSRIHR